MQLERSLAILRPMIYMTENRDQAAISQLLCKYGIRPTQQRIEIASLLLAKPQHLSADQVLSRVNSKTNLVSKATVYNTLNLFAEKGLIRQVIIDPGKVFYDSNTQSHHHMYNEDSGMLQDIAVDNAVTENFPPLPANVVKTGIDIIFRVKNKV